MNFIKQQIFCTEGEAKMYLTISKRQIKCNLIKAFVRFRKNLKPLFQVRYFVDVMQIGKFSNTSFPNTNCNIFLR